MKKHSTLNIQRPTPKAKPANSPQMMEAFERIAKHRSMQRDLVRQGKANLDMGAMVPSESRKLRRLAQGVGAIGDAIESMEERYSISAACELEYAITALAADCVAWMEVVADTHRKIKCFNKETKP